MFSSAFSFLLSGRVSPSLPPTTLDDRLAGELHQPADRRLLAVRLARQLAWRTPPTSSAYAASNVSSVSSSRTRSTDFSASMSPSSTPRIFL